MTTPTPPATTEQPIRDWLTARGFRADSSGWLLRGSLRIVLHPDGRLNIFGYERETGDRWVLRSEGMPRWALAALLRDAEAVTR